MKRLFTLFLPVLLTLAMNPRGMTQGTGAALTDSIVINEINYHSADDFNPGDWVEFYNPMNAPLNIANWKFKDELDTHEFIFPQGAVIPAHGYLVLVEDVALFTGLFPDVHNYMGPMGFGFSGGGELLRVYNAASALVDTVHYDDVAPWPTEPDGNGPTLELTNPTLDNALAQSWKTSCEPHGTPGVQNCQYTGIADPGPSTMTGIQVLPNPFHGAARIILKTPREIRQGTLTVYNILGREVMKIPEITTGEFTLYQNTLPAGSYVIRFEDPATGTQAIGKLIIN